MQVSSKTEGTSNIVTSQLYCHMNFFGVKRTGSWDTVVLQRLGYVLVTAVGIL
jgi:hypothetical protein